MTRRTFTWRDGLILVAAVVGIVVTFRLGLWQLSRVDEKEAQQAAMDAREQLPAIPPAALVAARESAQIDPLLHRAVHLDGQWLPDATVFLDNRSMDGRAGFFVLTPLRLAGDAGVVLVLRGWAPRNFQQRDALPPVPTPAGPVAVTGRVMERVPAVFALGRESGGRIRQNLDLGAYRVETGLPLAATLVQQTGPASDGLQRDWPPPATGVDRNYGYAFQWFGLCTLMALLFLWFQVVRPFLRSPRA